MDKQLNNIIEKIELREIEEEIFEALYDLTCDEGNRNSRIKMSQILDKIPNISKAHLVNTIRRKLEYYKIPNEKSIEPIKLIDYIPYEGVKLTTTGMIFAEKTARNHRIAGAILYQIFEMSIEIVCEQACILEHGITDEMIDSFTRKVKYPISPTGKLLPGSSKKNPVFKDILPLNDIKINKPVKMIFYDDFPSTIRELTKLGIHTITDRIIINQKKEKFFDITVNDNKKQVPIQLVNKIHCIGE